MNKQDILVILGEAPFIQSDPLSNPSASWLRAYFSKSNLSILMRGTKDLQVDANTRVFSLPSAKNTLSMLSGLFLDANFRKEFFSVRKVIRQQKESASKIWLRAPSLIPLLLSGCWRKEYAQKMHIHICANRLTFSFFKKQKNVVNFIKFLNGKATTFILKQAEKKGATFYHTGSQVQEAFGIKESKYLIDYLPKKYDFDDKRQGLVFLGRTSKLKGNAELTRFVNVTSNNISLYGPGDTSELPECVNYKGVVSPELVAEEISQYEALVCITNEYYEGFPRVLAEAISQEMWVVVNESCTFYNDLVNYPYLITSEDVKENEDLEALLSSRDETISNNFTQLIEKRSLLNG